MKTYAPKTLHGGQLRGLLDELGSTPEVVAKHLHVTERSVWRWLAGKSAPYAVLAALWHETATGRETCALDVGNDLVIQRNLSGSLSRDKLAQTAQLRRVLAISDTGAANDPLLSGPRRVSPLSPYPVAQRGYVANDDGGYDGAAQSDQSLTPQFGQAWQ